MNPTSGKLYHASVNACLAPLVSVDGKHVITVEVRRIPVLGPSPLKTTCRGLEIQRNLILRSKESPWPVGVNAVSVRPASLW